MKYRLTGALIDKGFGRCFLASFPGLLGRTAAAYYLHLTLAAAAWGSSGLSSSALFILGMPASPSRMLSRLSKSFWMWYEAVLCLLGGGSRSKLLCSCYVFVMFPQCYCHVPAMLVLC